MTFVKTLSDPEEVTMDTSALTLQDLLKLRKDDPFMYHSIVNEINGNHVCSFLSESPADVAAGGVSSSTSTQGAASSNSGEPSANLPRSRSLPDVSQLRAKRVVKRQRRLTTETRTLDLDEFFGSAPARNVQLNHHDGPDLMDEILSNFRTSLEDDEVESDQDDADN